MGVAYTSVKDGNWTDPATWGSSTNYPGDGANGDGDTATINHNVVYDRNSTVQLGNIRIADAKKLSVSRTVDTLLILASGATIDRVSGYPLLDWGNELDPVPANVTAKMQFAGTGTVIANIYGSMTFAGSSDYYGGIIASFLTDDWTSGQTIYVEDNVEGKWKPGFELLIHKNANYSNWATDSYIVTINTVTWNGSKSVITINESFPGGVFYAGARVLCLSRNVEISRYNAVRQVGQYNSTARIYMYGASYAGASYSYDDDYSKNYCGDTSFIGIELSGGQIRKYKIANSVIRNGSVVSTSLPISKIENCIFCIDSNIIQYDGTCIVNNCYFCNCGLILYGSVIVLYNCEIFACGGFFNAWAGGSFTVYSCYFYSNYSIGTCMPRNFISRFINCYFSQNRKNQLKLNSYDLSFGDGIMNYIHNIKLNNMVILRTSASSAKIFINGINNDFSIRKLICVTHDIEINYTEKRKGDFSFKIILYPQLDGNPYAEDHWRIFSDSFHEYLQPGTYNRYFYVKTKNLTSFPTGKQFEFEVFYIDSNGNITSNIFTGALTQNDVWTKFETTFTLTQPFDVYYVLWMRKYYAGEFYVDGCLYRGSDEDRLPLSAETYCTFHANETPKRYPIITSRRNNRR